MAEAEKSCAECKYRWSKVVDTSTPDVGFYPSYSNSDPILLSWDGDLKAYYSADQKIVCGDYHGNLVVDGKVFPVDPFNVRTYTFEIDLFLKDDVSDEDTSPIKTTEQHRVTTSVLRMEDSNNGIENTSDPISIKPKDSISQQTEDVINNVMSSSKPESLSKRHSPIGDDNVKSYNEFSPIKGGSDHSLGKDGEEMKNRPSSRLSAQNGKHEEVIEDLIDDKSDISRLSEASLREDRPASVLNSSFNQNSSAHNSVRDSSSTEAIYRRPSPNDRYTPTRSSKPGSDLYNLNKESVISPHNSFSRGTPTRDITSPALRTSVENGEVQSRSRPPSHPTSRHSSNHGSRPHSHCSITSEQELGQYMGHGSRSSSLDRSGPTGAATPTHSMQYREPDRLPSAHSYSNQQIVSDTRSMTPDNRIRIPQSPIKDLQESDLRLDTAISESRLSSRTITPVSGREIHPSQVRDLEDAVANLRKLLTKREAEAHELNAKISDLKDINRSLKEDLEHAKMNRPGTSDEVLLELKQTIAEKEILTTEIVSLRDEVQRLKIGSSSRSSRSSEISNYSPNNPSVLMRKIADLESHMRDLQEANESAMGKLGKAEHNIRSLEDENKDLKSRNVNSSSKNMQDGEDGHKLRVELITMREDLRNLKERNFQLTEENVRLYEAKSKDSNGHSDIKLNGSLRSDDGIGRSHAHLNHREKVFRSSYAKYDEHRSDLSHHTKTREDLTQKDYKNDKMYESGPRSLLQRESIEHRLRHSPNRDDLSHLESSRSFILQSDRSRPDGEISEKLQSQPDSKYYKTYLSKDNPRVSRDIHEFRPRNLHQEERLDRAGITEKDFSSYSTSTSLSSKEIFYNLKQKRANQWLQQDKHVSGNLEGSRSLSLRHNNILSTRPSYAADDVGDDSDTATDILLAPETGHKTVTSHTQNNLRGSNESLSSLSDGESPDASPHRKRSKSVEFRRNPEFSLSRPLLRSGSATRPLNSLDSTKNSSGLRTVIPTPLATQHNKSNLNTSSTSLLNSTLTQGMRPFAPCSPSDVRSGDVVKFSRVGGKLTQGTVKYVGHLPGRSDVYLGVELDKDEGKHDGTFEGNRYFKCKPNKGVFVAFNKIVMAWAP